MPGNWEHQNSKILSSSNASTGNASSDNLEECMIRLKIQDQDRRSGLVDNSSSHPDRPGEKDCVYYLRTGSCGYGSNCRFNHPPHTGQMRDELPDREGEPDCQYFLKTGTCKFGATCKYHHPRDRLEAGQVPLNSLGLPMREDEKSCPYYMRTGLCKFGFACKFHHPQPAFGAIQPMTGSSYLSMLSSRTLQPGISYVGGLPSWSIQRMPYISGPQVQAYMPVVVSPTSGVIPSPQGWGTYKSAPTLASSTDTLASILLYNTKHSEDFSPSAAQSSSTTIQHFPERPEQPECIYYMKTGNCKFGATCKYHHPKERTVSPSMDTIGPLGLPLRPGQTLCTLYSRYGLCSFGSTCKFDHPLTGFYNYIPALTISEPSFISPLIHSLETSPSKKSGLSDQLSEPMVSISKQEDTQTERLEEPNVGLRSASSQSPNLESPNNQSE